MRRDSDAAKLGARLAAGAIFVAPFVALLYRVEAGLIVMALALGATSLLVHGLLDEVPARPRRWLRLMVALNVLLMAACLVAAGWLVARG